MAGGTEVIFRLFYYSIFGMQLNLVSQALASLLSKRVGGAEKEKDLFELPALPKKVFWSCFFLPSSIDFRRKT